VGKDVVVALDVGGTGIKCALVDASGTVRHSERHPTGAEQGSDAVVAGILDIAEGLVATARRLGLDPTAVGIIVPGVIDEEAGIAVWAANVGFRDVPLRKLTQERLGLPTALGHDVRGGGLAEARLGAGQGYRHVFAVMIGTGIAAASIVDGKVFTGAHGAAGEIGHIVVRPQGPRCGCGQRGCLEAVASAAAVGRHYTELSGRSAGADEVAALAQQGDPVAAEVWRDTIDALADGLLIGIALFDPAVMVIGGGLAEAGDTLMRPLADALHSRVTFHREPELRRAALGDEAGSLGAALLALDLLGSGDS